MGYFENTILDAQDSTLKSVWKFEGNLIDDKEDQDLTLSGTAGSYVSGKRGQGYDFVYGANNLSVDTVDTYPQEKFLLSMWIKIDGSTSGMFNFPVNLPGIVVGITEENWLYAAMLDDQNELHTIHYNAAPDNGNFVNVVIGAYDDYFFMFVDAVQYGMEKFSGGIRQYSNDNTLRLGNYSSQVLDEVYIWNEPTFSSICEFTQFVGELYNYFAKFLPLVIEETLVLTDVLGEDNFIYADIQESLILSDVYNAGQTFVGEISESIQFSDLMYYGWAEELLESLGLSDDPTAHYILAQCIIEDSILFIDDLTWGWIKELAESIGFADAASYVLGVTIKELLYITDNHLVNWNGREFIYEDLPFNDSMVIGKIFVDLLQEGLGLSDAFDQIISIFVLEYMNLNEVNDISWNGAEVIAESLYFGDDDRAVKLFIELINDGFSVSEALNVSIALIVKESLGFALANLSQGTLGNVNEENIGFADSYVAAYLMQIAEQIGLSDTLSYGFVLLCALAESIGFADADIPVRTTSPEINESLDMATSEVIRSTLIGMIDESLGFDIGFTLGGEAWQCWVMNTKDFHASVYSNFDFNSYAVYDGETFAAKDSGIYKLTGDSDEGDHIAAGVSLPATKFGSLYNKRLRRGHFGMAGGKPALRVETDNGFRVYDVIGVKCNIGRDLKGKTWELELQDFEEVDFIELIPIILTR